MKSRIVFILALSPYFYSLPGQAVQKPDATVSLTDSNFFTQTRLNMTLRNQWKYLKENEAQPKTVHNAWGQAIQFDYLSGYLWDVVGVDATWNRAIKLGASDYFVTRGLLYNHGEGMDKENAHGFSKFGQRYLKLKLGNDSTGIKAKAGWQALTNFGVLTTANRLSRNSYLGYSSTFNWQKLSLDTAYVTKAIRFDSPQSLHLETNDKKNIRAIYTAGVTYRQPDNLFSYSWGEADNYLRRHRLEAAWQIAPAWHLSSQVYGSEGLDKYTSMPASKREFDRHAWHYVGQAQWQNNGWKQRMVLAWTSAPRKNGVGYYARPLTKNTRGRFNALTSAGKDYMRDKELALVSLTEYQFIRDLVSGIQFNYGQFSYKNQTVRSGEVALVNSWNPSARALKNLSVFTLFGYGVSYKNNRETPLFNDQGKPVRSPSLSAEIAINYKFGLFN